MTLPLHLSAAVEQINEAYLADKPRTWSSRYPQDRACTGADPKWIGYEAAKAAWQAANPEATPAEYTAAMRRLSNECEV